MSWRLRGDELAAHGDHPALASREATVSYGELAARAATVWRQLRRAGALPGDSVALLSSGRAHDEPVALAGTLTLGAVAVPLDATAPALRLASIVRARGCRAVVADRAARGALDGVFAALDAAGEPRRPATIVLDEQGQVVGSDEARGSWPDAARDHALCAILHTSGSTGTPKPVPVTWAGMDAFTGWMVGLAALIPGDRVLRVAELIFDLAWFDHLATWRAGATLATMPRRELASGRSFKDALAALAPTVVYGVPSLFMKLVAALREGELVTPAPRTVFFAGEVFPPRELAAFAARVPAAALHNLYGPTETNVCTHHRLRPEDLDGQRETPIGIACPYARCRLVDEQGAELHGPATGELHVEGPTCLAGAHATRDRVERRDDGLFYFRGRIDRMVKIRGYRVEPGEVEISLTRHPSVRAAAVVVHDDARLGKTLRAFVELREGAEVPAVAERDLRVFLAERLPPYMVPDKVTIVAELPLGSTGKIDRAALTGA